MTDKQIEKLYEIKNICCERVKDCYKPCFHCCSHCNEYLILTLVNEVLNDR